MKYYYFFLTAYMSCSSTVAGFKEEFLTSSKRTFCDTVSGYTVAANVPMGNKSVKSFHILNSFNQNNWTSTIIVFAIQEVNIIPWTKQERHIWLASKIK